VTERLNRVEELAPDSGKLDLYGWVDPYSVGASLDLEARIHDNWAVFGEARAEYDYRRRELDAHALLGARLRW